MVEDYSGMITGCHEKRTIILPGLVDPICYNELAMQRLLMIMGIQRSGTNALFHSFAKGGACIPRIDVESDEVYDQFYLRPEHEIRSVLAAQSKPILLKPVFETTKRNIDSLLEEYRNYDLSILYIYRDPVNSYFSQTEKWPQYTDVDYFIQDWNRRNLYAVNISPEWKSRLGIVKYQDLADDPKVFDVACDFFKITGTYLFRKDKNRGRQHLSVEIQRKIDEGTREVLDRMDQSRSFLPGQPAFSFRKIYRNTRFFLIQQLRKLQLLPQ